MRDATVERFSQIVSESRSETRMDRSGGPQPRRSALKLRWRIDEGWFSLFLVTTVVYTTIWSVQAAAWVDHLNILTLTTALGLIAGLLSAKWRRIQGWLACSLAIVLGAAISVWQTAGTDFNGNLLTFWGAVRLWATLAWSGGTSGDDSVFLLFITLLGFLLAFASAWLVYRTRSPWLMIVANSVVLLINLNNLQPGYLIFLVVFLLAGMLLLLRFNLYESTQRWRRLNLRCADDLGWDFMQAGLIISIAILALSWIMPSGYINDYAAQVWSTNNNPWTQIQGTWNRLVAVNGGINPANRGNFTDSLVLGGNPNLNNDIVFSVASNDGPQYLAAATYDTYSGRGWQNGTTYTSPLDKNVRVNDEGALSHLIQQTITVVNPPGEQLPYLFAPPQVASVDQSALILTTKTTGSLVALLHNGGHLAAGDRYVTNSYSSSADIKTLQSVPMPADSPHLPPSFNGQPPITFYDPSILQTYLQLPSGLDPNVLTKAQDVTANAHTMYDRAVALESYLRTFTYSTNIRFPSGEEGTSWLLFRSGQQGFCNYFSTAMSVMARELGMPSRVVVGYAPGDYDIKSHQWIVRGVQAHSWTQVYFAGYGWINFEPSPSFASFTRPLPNQFAGNDPNSTNTGTTPINPNQAHRGDRPSDLTNGDTASNLGNTSNTGDWRQPVSYTLISLLLFAACLLALFVIWWRRLFRDLRISSQIYGRICMVASWAGISMRRSQTPTEYLQVLSAATPDQTVTLERVGDIYVRELWANPASQNHPQRSGETAELPGLWLQLQPRLFFYMLRHPEFLRRLPLRMSGLLTGQLSTWRGRRRKHDIKEVSLEASPEDEGVS